MYKVNKCYKLPLKKSFGCQNFLILTAESFCDLKIWWNGYFASFWLAKMHIICSICEIQGTYFESMGVTLVGLAFLQNCLAKNMSELFLKSSKWPRSSFHNPNIQLIRSLAFLIWLGLCIIIANFACWKSHQDNNWLG